MRRPRFALPKRRLPQPDDVVRARSKKPRYATPVILLEYTQDGNKPSQVWARRFVFISLIGFCLFYGLAFALLAPFLMVAFAIPLVIIGAFIIWALPDTRTPPVQALEFFLFAFIISSVAWPNYIALALPGLPWITIARLTDTPLALILLVCLSTSADFRDEIKKIWNNTPVIKFLFISFVLIQTLSVFFSAQKSESIQKYFVAQTGWTVMFFVGIYVFSKPGRAERMAKTMWALAMFVGLIGLAEWRAEHVLWAGHIPSFLKINDPSVVMTLAGSRRLHFGAYRVVSTFENPLGLGEYMALTMPFVIHFAMGTRASTLRLAGRLSVPFILFVAFVSGSRLGIIGCLLGLVFSSGIWAFLRWKRSPNDLVAKTILLAYPVVTALGAASIMFVGRLRHIVWGTGAQAYSDMARQDQISMGLPLILKHPWGYGIGRAAETLGYAPFGFLTIDNYFLSIALDYGVLGFIAFYGMLLAAIVYSGKRVVDAPLQDPELDLLKATAVALANFIIIKSVFSEEGSNPIIFMLLGMTVALLHRARLPAVAAVTETTARLGASVRRLTVGRAIPGSARGGIQ